MKKLSSKLTPAIAIAAMALTALLSGCEYEFVEPENVPVPTQVSFATDIVPIFDASCNMSGCHAAGAFSPDLSPANAFNSITQENLINVDTPAQSTLYLVVSSGSMKSYATTAQAKLILAWIQQGALNN